MGLHLLPSSCCCQEVISGWSLGVFRVWLLTLKKTALSESYDVYKQETSIPYVSCGLDSLSHFQVLSHLNVSQLLSEPGKMYIILHVTK